MNDEKYLPVVSRSTLPAVASQDETAIASASGDSLQVTLQHCHRALRGRYRLVVALSLICAAIAAAAGWYLAPRIYRSEGLVRLAPAMPQVFEQTEQNRALGQMYDAFLQSQKLLLTSRRVIDQAVLTQTWQATGRGHSSDVIKGFAEFLLVDIKPPSEVISVAYGDEDPVAAAAGVNAIIEVYSNIYKTNDQQQSESVLAAAEQRRGEISKRMDELQTQIAGASEQFGTNNVDPLYDTAVERVKRLEGSLAETKMAIPAAPDAPPVNVTPQPPTAQLSVMQIAARDEIMRKYCEEVGVIEAQLDLLRTRLGENHTRVTSAQEALRIARERVERYAQEYRLTGPGPGNAPGEQQRLVELPKTKAQLQGQLAEVTTLLEQARKEMVAVGQARKTLASLQTQRDQERDELVKVTRRIDTLRAESSVGGRLSIVSRGEAPLMPSLNYKPRIAAAAGFGGLLLPPALFLLMGLCRRRFRYSDDAQVSMAEQAPILGILPMLRGEPGEQDAIAAQCVHQIRVMLQSDVAKKQSQVFLLSSTSAGEGKTSMTMALALSFAASGVKTLVIDCDLTARTLSRCYGEAPRTGLPEALAAGDVNPFVTAAGYGLSILTAGSASMLDANTLRAHDIRRLIGTARQDYDVVLIDSGPILGSIEAAVTARETDGVIFTVARGQEQSLVNRAMSHVTSLGARVVGVIFNRAESRDFYRSTYVSAHRSMAPDPLPTPTPEVPGTSTFGPLVAAVLRSLPQARRAALT